MAPRAAQTPLFGKLLEELRDRRLGKRSSLREAEKLTVQGRRRVSHSSIGKYEGGRQPGVSELQAMARAYGLRWESLASALLAEINGEARTIDALRAIAAADDDLPPALLPVTHQDIAHVGVLEDPIAAGDPLLVDAARVETYLPFDADWLARQHITAPICVRVGDDERSMMPTISPGELVMVDCAQSRRITVNRDRIYAVNVDNRSALKRVLHTPGRIFLLSDNPDKSVYYTREVAVDVDQPVLDFIVGEVVWRGQRPL